MKKLLALLLAIVMVTVVFTGCGATEAMKDNYVGGYVEEAPMEEAPMAAAPMEDAWAEDYESGISSASGSAPAAVEGQKIITTLNLYAQTENMDPLLEQINGKIAQLGGYMEAQEIYNGSSYDNYRYRNAYLTIRIPADQLDSFVIMVQENANVVRQSTSTENVTLTYVGIQSRITALETEQERLLELLAQAQNMEDLLLIESRLTEVQAELENYTSQMRVLDNKINYSTIYLDLEEVTEYTPVDEEPKTVWERIGSGLGKNLKNIGKGFVNFFVWLIVAAPYLLIIGGIGLAVFLIIRGSIRRKRKRRAQQKKENSAE